MGNWGNEKRRGGKGPSVSWRLAEGATQGMRTSHEAADELKTSILASDTVRAG